MKPDWDALPTVWAVGKPKETFWLMPMRSVYSAHVGATTLTWGLSAVTQMQATVWNEMESLYESDPSSLGPMRRVFDIAQKWWLKPQELLIAPVFFPRAFAKVGLPFNGKRGKLSLPSATPQPGQAGTEPPSRLQAYLQLAQYLSLIHI